MRGRIFGGFLFVSSQQNHILRKGIVNFVRSKYRMRKDDILKLQKTAAIKSVSALQVKWPGADGA